MTFEVNYKGSVCTFNLTKTESKEEYVHDIDREYRIDNDPNTQNELRKLSLVLRSPKTRTQDLIQKFFDNYIAKRDGVLPPATETETTAESAVNVSKPEEKTEKELSLSSMKTVCGKLTEFFSEFSINPANSIRFLDTFMRIQDEQEERTYILNYYKISGCQDFPSVEEKMKSFEFKTIQSEKKNVKIEYLGKRINNRIKIYYGEPGTGKTTKAVAETSGFGFGANNSISCEDLTRIFTVKDSVNNLTDSVFVKAMKEGKKVFIDEINLLSEGVQRYLQTFTDNKKVVQINDETVEIKDGFEIIGTMNLNVGGHIEPLINVLVDRCSEIREFTLTPEQKADLLLSESSDDKTTGPVQDKSTVSVDKKEQFINLFKELVSQL